MTNINMEIIKLKGLAETLKGEYLRYFISNGINPADEGNVLVKNLYEISEIGKNALKYRTEDEIREIRQKLEGFRECIK
ncbi:MAG: hypothetical protein MJ081_07435 [Ruminococcus sp.]|nr:hypothetical protein [Ruminococcus sp.]